MFVRAYSLIMNSVTRSVFIFKKLRDHRIQLNKAENINTCAYYSL